MPPAEPQVQRGGDELHRLRGDLARRQRLQGELAGVDVTAAVAADVDDQPVLRQQRDQPDELVPERRPGPAR